MPNVRADKSQNDALSGETAEKIFVYRVLLFAGLRDAAQLDAIDIRSSQPSLPSTELMHLASEQFPVLSPFLSYVRLAINCEYSNLDSPISPADEIAFIPPVSGGQELLPLIELTHQAIDTARVIEAARSRLHGGEGAVLTFEGVVRDNAEGQKVKLLEYECYEPMALRELRKIGDEVRARWDLPCAMTHRLGRVEIGEASIVICVASPHRAEAFDACRFAIDSVKKTVPIWKKEFMSDGSWWVESPAKPSSPSAT
jgi:molybdopterin synthase catalytic subunit